MYKYTVIFETDEETGDVTATFPALNLATQGRDLDEARTMAREALQVHLAGILEEGDPAPADVLAVESVIIQTLD